MENKKEQLPKPLVLAGADYSVTIPRQIYDQIMHWIFKAGKNEISGFGTIKYDAEKKDFMVMKAILLKQENQASHTEIDPQSLMKAMYELRNAEGEMRWWWHSHVQMGVFWSGTDMDTIQDLGKNGWILATVFNQKHEKRSAFLTKSETNSALLGQQDQNIFVDEIPTSIVSYYDTTMFDEWDEAFKTNVTEKKWNTITPYTPAQTQLPGTRTEQTFTSTTLASIEKYAKDEFNWLSSPYFENDLRFYWRKTFTDSYGNPVYGQWEVKTEFAARAETITESKITMISAEIKRNWPVHESDVSMYDNFHQQFEM